MSESTYKDYFLGSLTEESATEVELRVLDDAEFAAELSNAEEELIESYLEGELIPDEARLFRTKYLVTNERIGNFETVKLLKLHARTSSANEAESMASETLEKQGFFRWLGEMRPVPKFATAVALLIAVAATGWWLTRPRPNSELLALQTQYEMLNQDAASVELRSVNPGLTLFPGKVRSLGPEAAITRSGIAENLLVRVAMPPDVELAASYVVTLFRWETEVFRMNRIPPFANAAGQELRLLFPQEVLKPASYKMTLQNEKMQIVTYYFTVKE